MKGVFARFMAVILFSVLPLSCRNYSSQRYLFSENQPNAQYSQADLSRLDTAIANGEQTIPVIAIANSPEDVVARLANEGGATVLHMDREFGYLAIEMSPQFARSLPDTFDLQAIELDRELMLDPIESGRLRLVDGALPDLPAFSGNGPNGFLPIHEIHAPEFSKKTGYRGKGVVIAVLDTGCELRHPGLMQTRDGRPKIVDFFDFTDDGSLHIENAEREGDYLRSPTYGQVKMSVWGRDAANYYLGRLDERTLVTRKPDHLVDLNRDGDLADEFLVAIYETADGVYWGVVDTNGDRSVDDSSPIQNYKDSVTMADKKRNTVALDPNGLVNAALILERAKDNSLREAHLGFVTSSHGTHTAGIAAGYRMFNGNVNGVAPDAQIMALKVLGNGRSTLLGVHRAIIYAARAGADVINMSLGMLPEMNDGRSPTARIINQVSERFGTHFVIAAGNDGPGINTVAMPGTASSAVTVGATLSPLTLASNYGVTTLHETVVWFFSSVGPRIDGGGKPDLVAPGSAISTAALWDYGHMATQGTSMAAPFVSGAISLLLEAAVVEHLPHSPAAIKRALVESADPLAGYTFVEQGSGVVNVDAAYTYLRGMPNDDATFAIATRNHVVSDTGEGVYVRGYRALEQRANVRRVFPKNVALRDIMTWAGIFSLESTMPWVTTPESLMLIADRPTAVAMTIDFKQLLPGLHAAKVKGRGQGAAEESGKNDFEVPIIVIYPRRFSDENDYRVQLSGTVNPGRVRRYFFKVPSQTTRLNVHLGQEREKGRLDIAITSPLGVPVPLGSMWRKQGAERFESVLNPETGIWEVDVYASPALPEPIAFSLEANITAVVSEGNGLMFYDLIPGQSVSSDIELINLFRGTKAGQYSDIQGYESRDRFGVSANNTFTQPITVPPGATALRITTDGKATADIDIELVDSGGTVVSVSRNRGAKEEIDVQSIPPGQYTLHLVAGNLPNGAREVSVSVVVRIFVPVSVTLITDTQFTFRETFERWTSGIEIPVVPPPPPHGYDYFGKFYVVTPEKTILFSTPIRLRYSDTPLLG